MSQDPRKRQKKLARRTAKRKERRHVLVKERNAGVGQRLAAAARYPLVDCMMTERTWEEGIGQIVLSRQLPDGSIAAAVFLVDTYCLGVKDAFGDIVSRFSYESDFLGKLKSEHKWEDIPPAKARKIVESAVAYAAGLGLHPHPDYAKVKPIFGDIDTSQCQEEFEFGQDGKPLFVAGPFDTPDRCRKILGILNHKLGPDRFHYVLPIGGSSNMQLLRNGQEEQRYWGFADEGDEDDDEE
jgi:hypothetical protein